MKALLEKLNTHTAGFIDTVQSKNDCLIVEGWSLIFDHDPILPPKRIFLMANGQVISESNELVDERPDVYSAYGLSEGECCGFIFNIPNKGNIDAYEIECFVESGQGDVYQLQKSSELSCWLQLELTGRCNLRCPQCPSALYSGFHQQDLNEDDLEHVKPLLNKVNALCFDGFGEVLLAKQLEKALSLVPIHKPLEFHTNGMLLGKKMELLLNYAPPLRRIIVSLDSLKEPVYDVLRKGGDLELVLGNIKSFIEERKQRKQNFPKIIPNMTIMRDNYKEMMTFVDLASECDQMVEFLYLYDAPKFDDSSRNTNNDSTFDYESQRPANFLNELRQELQQVFEYAKRKKVLIYFSGSMTGLPNEIPDANDFIGKRRPLSECTAVKAGHCMQADGKFTLCVWQTAPIFNWRETGNVDPLEDPRGKKVVEMILEGVIPKECSGAACEFVGRELSNDNYDSPDSFTSGGWQV